jgi:hypothetical protein
MGVTALGLTGATAAILGAAEVGAGTSLITGVMGADAQKNAAETYAASANNAADIEWAMYRQNRQDALPWLTAGANALGQISSGLQPGGKWSDFNYSGNVPTLSPFTANEFSFNANDLYADPSYAWRKSEALDAIKAASSAAGNFGSGNMATAMMGAASNMASTEYANAWSRDYNVYSDDWKRDYTVYSDDWTRKYAMYQDDYVKQYSKWMDTYNLLTGVSGGGQVTASNLGQMGTNVASSVSDLVSSTGKTTAASITGSANAWGNALTGATNQVTSGVGTYLNLLQQEKLLSALGYGGGSSYAPTNSTNNFSNPATGYGDWSTARIAYPSY